MTLAAFIKQRAERAYRNLMEIVESLTAEEALAYGDEAWPGHRWGVGQDGSMAGIVYHVAAWKQLTLPLFQKDGRALTREEFDADSAPARDDWQGIRAWLKQVGMAWNAELAALQDTAFEETRDWEGTALPLATFIAEMYEHDIQHTAQLEYLRSRHAVEMGTQADS